MVVDQVRSGKDESMLERSISDLEQQKAADSAQTAEVLRKAQALAGDEFDRYTNCILQASTPEATEQCREGLSPELRAQLGVEGN